jgi:hypothetical protein
MSTAQALRRFSMLLPQHMPALLLLPLHSHLSTQHVLYIQAAPHLLLHRFPSRILPHH